MSEATTRQFLSRLADAARRIDPLEVARAADLLWQARQRGATILVIGNGGSASTASHFAADLAKGTVVEGCRRFNTLCLAENATWMTALSNDLGFQHLFSEPLRNLMRPRDLLVVFSVHGGKGADRAGEWSQNLLRAVEVAQREFQASILAFVGFDGGPLRQCSDVSVLVPVESTPLIESLHVALHHLLCEELRARIEACG
ncbi:MAG: SIS domain-containing protein [Acidobacteriota bacterium]